MLKIVDENGKLRFTLDEEDTEPQPVEKDQKILEDESEGEEKNE
jgi:hypothetical protein